MTALCIHGFTTEHCASCRTCPHGLESYRCSRCLTAATAIARKRLSQPAPDQALHDHQGFEIYWVPDVAGWQYRAPDSAPSVESYRSVFLARKAIDGLGSASAAAGSKRRK